MKLLSLTGVVVATTLASGCASTGAATVGVRADDADRAAWSSPSGTTDADAVSIETEGLRVVETYPAASGRLCRRLSTPSGTILSRVSCRRSDGFWELGRALGGTFPSDGSGSPTGSSLLAPASPLPKVVPAEATVPADLSSEGSPSGPRAKRPDDTPVVSVALDENETLRGFAARTTGDPLRSPLIARYGGIENELDVQSGRELAVPASVASTAR